MPAPARHLPLERSPFVLALAASALLVLSAPFMGEARHWLRQTFPTHFVAIVSAGVALAVLAAARPGRRRASGSIGPPATRSLPRRW